MQIKIDGIIYQLRVGTDRVYERGDECRFVGMLRSDGTIEYGVDDDDIIPPGVKPPMMPGYNDSSLDPRFQTLDHKACNDSSLDPRFQALDHKTCNDSSLDPRFQALDHKAS